MKNAGIDTLRNIYKFYHATHENVVVTCSKVESIIFCGTLQQHFFTIFCCTARKKHLWDRVQFFHTHATQQIAPRSLTLRGFLNDLVKIRDVFSFEDIGQPCFHAKLFKCT